MKLAPGTRNFNEYSFLTEMLIITKQNQKNYLQKFSQNRFRTFFCNGHMINNNLFQQVGIILRLELFSKLLFINAFVFNINTFY